MTSQPPPRLEWEGQSGAELAVERGCGQIGVMEAHRWGEGGWEEGPLEVGWLAPLPIRPVRCLQWAS